MLPIKFRVRKKKKILSIPIAAWSPLILLIYFGISPHADLRLVCDSKMDTAQPLLVFCSLFSASNTTNGGLIFT